MCTLLVCTSPLSNAVTRIVPELVIVFAQAVTPAEHGVDAAPLSGTHCQDWTAKGNLYGYTLSGVPNAVKVTLIPLVTTYLEGFSFRFIGIGVSVMA